MGKARAGRAPLVQQHVDVTAGAPCPQSPSLGDAIEFLVGQLADGPDVAGRVDDDLLPFECGVEVRDDANAPRAFERQPQRLGRRAVLASLAERAGGELLGRRRLDRPDRRSRPSRAGGRDDDESPRDRIPAKLAAQGAGCCGGGDAAGAVSRSARSMNGRIRSIGAGKMIVDEFVPPISSRVCR